MTEPTFENEHAALMAVLGRLLDADVLGDIVRQAWIEWANLQPNPKPAWLVPWTELDEADKEADRMIGLAVACFVVTRMHEIGQDMLQKAGTE